MLVRKKWAELASWGTSSEAVAGSAAVDTTDKMADTDGMQLIDMDRVDKKQEALLTA